MLSRFKRRGIDHRSRQSLKHKLKRKGLSQKWRHEYYMTSFRAFSTNYLCTVVTNSSTPLLWTTFKQKPPKVLIVKWWRVYLTHLDMYYFSLLSFFWVKVYKIRHLLMWGRRLMTSQRKRNHLEKYLCLF